MLLGLVTPSAGSATVLGTSVSPPADHLDRVGAPIEAPAFYPTLSGRNDLEVLAALGGLPRERIDAALDTVDLSARGDDEYRSYSTEMKRSAPTASTTVWSGHARAESSFHSAQTP